MIPLYTVLFLSCVTSAGLVHGLVVRSASEIGVSGLVEVLLKYLPPALLIPVVMLILLLLFRESVAKIFLSARQSTADGLYVLHYAGYGKRVTTAYNESSRKIEDHPLNLYRSFSVQRKFLIRNVNGEIISLGNHRLIKTKALAEEIIKRFEEDHGGQPLDTHVLLRQRIRKVVDLILIGERIKEMRNEGTDHMLDQAYSRFVQDRLSDPHLFHLYDHIRRDIIEHEQNYEALRVLRSVNKDYVAMILNSIERGISIGKY